MNLSMHRYCSVYIIVLSLFYLTEAAADRAPVTLDELCVEWKVTDIWAYQSRNPEPPWDSSSGSIVHSLDMTQIHYAAYSKLNGAGGYNFHHVKQIEDGKGYIGSFIYGDIRHLDDDNLIRQADELFLFTPPLLLGYLEQSSIMITSPGDINLPETPFGNIELEIDKNYRLKTLKVFLPDENRRRLEYSSYLESNGVVYPSNISSYWNNTKYWNVQVTRFQPGNSCFDRMPVTDHLEPNTINLSSDMRAFSVRELAPGVWFIGEEVFYQLFIEFDDYIVAVGSVRDVRKRFNELTKQVPGKPLRYGVITHHHDDHLEGIPDLIDLGATLIVAPGHENIVRSMINKNEVKITPVENIKRIRTNKQDLILLDIANSHSAHNLIAWLPEHKILFSADLWVQQPERPVRAALGPTRDLAWELVARDIRPKIFIDPHSPRLNSAVDLEVALDKARQYKKRFKTSP